MTSSPEVLSPPAAQPIAAKDPGIRHKWQIWVFVVPAFIFQFFWGWYPMVVALFLSLTNAPIRGQVTFQGIDNYTRLFLDPLVPMAFRITLIYAGLSIVLTFAIPIFVAILLLEMPPKWMRIMMLLWYLPLSGIASTLFWQYLYNENFGIFQYIATAVVGLPPQAFLSSERWVIFWLIVPGVLLYGPGLYYMAGLQSIPKSYFEAAEIEGASFWRKIWTISLPRLRPIISMTLLFAIIGSLQEFSFPDLMTRGGPNGASRTVVMYMMSILSNGRYGDATALAVMLFILIMALVLIYRVLFKEDPDV
ncbi:MAG: sugar ABC transporter permease [Anaerolineales bacterium]|nr:sugar ABC transporter permease [Anaerolineales bacterium]